MFKKIIITASFLTLNFTSFAESSVYINGSQATEWVRSNFKSEAAITGDACEIRFVPGCASYGMEIENKNNGQLTRVEWYEGLTADDEIQLQTSRTRLQSLIVPKNGIFGGRIDLYQVSESALLVKLSNEAKVAICTIQLK